jgi:hypothetical protein
MVSKDNKGIAPQKRTVKGTFDKGNKPAPKAKKKLSPITATFCKDHYEKLCGYAEQGILEPKDLLALFKFEHDAMYGKAIERIEHTGADGEPIGFVGKPESDKQDVILAWCAAWNAKYKP